VLMVVMVGLGMGNSFGGRPTQADYILRIKMANTTLLNSSHSSSYTIFQELRYCFEEAVLVEVQSYGGITAAVQAPLGGCREASVLRRDPERRR